MSARGLTPKGHSSENDARVVIRFALPFTGLEPHAHPLVDFCYSCALCGFLSLLRTFLRNSAAPRYCVLAGKYAAKGAQIYVCGIRGIANEWNFKAPEAELIDAHGRLFAKHYAAPTWEAPDGSKIVGKVLASAPAPKAGAIPWLLLSAEASASGDLPACVLSNGSTSSGGVGSTGACLTVGTERRVAYTANYIFYK